ncbi:metal-dependent hydrolase [Aquirhabdus parva]|uniref:Metal-dependent hydrolase n=1 Tax=Aquirhabdus parva TaxID=2283318 RepID=A0A345P8D7_9GAMM|nr:metal-dependent hydrolase [Aquirhabdus parva]AXI03546.1 metal-dependent hydrolase [Aquirhabdus parva]
MTVAIRPITRPKAIGITVRRLAFQPARIPRQYFARSPLVSHLLTALSSTFPIGEQFFVHSVRNVRDRVKNDALQTQISAFIGQEAMHSQAHSQFNQSWRRDDYQLDSFMAWLAREDKRIKAVPARYQLAVTCAFEHFTAMLGEYILRNPKLVESFDQEAMRLWLWHAIEEAEHKSVAFDVYQEVFNDLKVRRQVMLSVTTGFASLVAYSTWRLFWQDRRNSLFALRGNLRGVAFLGHMFITLVPEYLDYFKADFHPAKRDRTALLDHWRKYLDETMKIAA